MSIREPRSRRRQRGLGLTELLAGTAIAMLVMLAAFGTLRVFREASAGSETLSRLQRQGAFALQLIGLQLRQAGAVEPAVDPTSGMHVFRSTGAGGSVISGTEGARGAPDSLTLTVQPPRAHAVGTVGTTPQYDCSGARIEGESPVAMRFEVDAGGRLMCRARNRQPVIEEVTDFQLRYRVRAEGTVQNLDAAAVEQQQLWGAVRAVEVCLELAADFQGPPQAIAEIGCDGRPLPQAAKAGRMHKVFRQLFGLRTRADGD